MPELVLLYLDGRVEHHPLDDALLLSWDAEDLTQLLHAVCRAIQPFPCVCRVRARWLADGRVTFEAWTHLQQLGRNSDARGRAG